MKQLYAIEPVFHDGELYLPGEEVNCDVNDAASMLGSGRATQDPERAATAKKQYAAAQKAAAATPAAAAAGAAGIDVQAIVNAAVTAALAAQKATAAAEAKSPQA